jgi:hypothetical protein
MQEKIQTRITATLHETDALNLQEDALYGDQALSINGKVSSPTEERIREVADEASRKIPVAAQKDKEKAKEKKSRKLHNRLDEDRLRASIYHAREVQCGDYSGYSRTDPDAIPMRTKECSDDLRPACNGLIGSENQYITGVSVHQNPNDGSCFGQHVEEAFPLLPRQPDIVVADAAFGTEENCERMEGKEGTDALLKYSSYDKEQKKSFQKDIFHPHNMPYDAENDRFLCPDNKYIPFIDIRQVKSKTGFTSTLYRYECEDCTGCPFFQQCGSGQRGENSDRQIIINKNLERHRELFREKLKRPENRERMKRRGHDVETCFGDIKGNQLFRRVHLRGLAKVKTEFTVIAMAHNIRKMQKELLKNAA